MSKTQLQSHILTDIVHGGFDDPAGLSFWIDPGTGIAHLTGHSGSMTPLDGPVAPEGVDLVEITGRSGYIKIFEEGEIEALRAQIDAALNDPDISHTPARLHGRIADMLLEIDLCEMSYEDWLAENEPETLAESLAP